MLEFIIKSLIQSIIFFGVGFVFFYIDSLIYRIKNKKEDER